MLLSAKLWPESDEGKVDQERGIDVFRWRRTMIDIVQQIESGSDQLILQATTRWQNERHSDPLTKYIWISIDEGRCGRGNATLRRLWRQLPHILSDSSDVLNSEAFGFEKALREYTLQQFEEKRNYFEDISTWWLHNFHDSSSGYQVSREHGELWSQREKCKLHKFPEFTIFNELFDVWILSNPTH